MSFRDAMHTINRFISNGGKIQIMRDGSFYQVRSLHLDGYCSCLSDRGTLHYFDMRTGERESILHSIAVKQHEQEEQSA